jgi:DNA-directed RNA polymerase subunit alpha
MNIQISNDDIIKMLVTNGVITESDTLLPFEITLLPDNNGLSVSFTGRHNNSVYTQKQIDFLEKPLDVLDLSIRTYNCLKADKINKLAEVINLTEKELLKACRNMGQKSLSEMIKLLNENGLELKKE